MKKNSDTIFLSSDASYNKLFTELKTEFLKLDPVCFAESYLKIKGDPFKLVNCGRKYMTDLIRYIGIKAAEPTGKPVVILKGRQVGATVMAAALDLYFTASGLFGEEGNKPISVLHCFPQLSLVQRFSQADLGPMIDTSTNDFINQQKMAYNPKTKKVSSSKPDNMTLKQFKHNCNLWIDSLGVDGDRIRGMSCDVAFFDEVQGMSATAIGVALKTLVQSKYGRPGHGIQVYFGTPKQKGSYFETALWNQSDKRYYFLGCLNKECGHYFMLSTPGTEDWQKMWLHDHIIQCPKCGVENDKRALVENGKWQPTEPFNKDGSEKRFVGYHISQLYDPMYNKQYILDQRPENNPASSERIYYNETLGEFYSGVDQPISRDEIYEKCRDSERSFTRIVTKDERRTFMGVDWGGKTDTENSSAGQSYSCVVVLSADSGGVLNVEFAYRMKSSDFQHKMDFMREMFKNYSLRVAAADIGFGHDVVGELQKIYGNKFLACRTSGNLKKNVSFDKEILEIKWDKDYFIEEMFDLMRKGKIRFPWRSFEKMDWLIDHITSMESDHKIVAGLPKKSYKKGPTPNDGFMALIYAYLAYRFELTKSFSINLNHPADSTFSMPILAYLPKMK